MNGVFITITGIFSCERKSFGDEFSGSLSSISYIVSLDDTLLEENYIEYIQNK